MITREIKVINTSAATAKIVKAPIECYKKWTSWQNVKCDSIRSDRKLPLFWYIEYTHPCIGVILQNFIRGLVPFRRENLVTQIPIKCIKWTERIIMAFVSSLMDAPRIVFQRDVVETLWKRCWRMTCGVNLWTTHASFFLKKFGSDSPISERYKAGLIWAINPNHESGRTPLAARAPTAHPMQRKHRLNLKLINLIN